MGTNFLGKVAAPLLLIQSITLVWHKESRGASGAETRARFPLAYPIEEAASPLPPGEAMVHTLCFYQCHPGEIITNREECRRGLEQYLPRLGFSRKQVSAEIARRQREMGRVQFLAYPDHLNLNLTNLSFRPLEESWEIVFRWDEQRSGLPYRRGRNQDYNNPDSRLYRKDCLNETAFVLAPGQTGRLIWNERDRGYDDGIWFYRLNVCNAAALPGREFPPEVFLLREPDFVYRQLAELY